MNEYFYETIAREKLRGIEELAEQIRLASGDQERRRGGLGQWRERLHLTRRPKQPRSVVARGADQAG